MPSPMTIMYVVGSIHAAAMLTMVVHHTRSLWRCRVPAMRSRVWLFPWLLLFPDMLDKQGKHHRIRVLVYTSGAVLSLGILAGVYHFLDKPGGFEKRRLPNSIIEQVLPGSRSETAPATVTGYRFEQERPPESFVGEGLRF